MAKILLVEDDIDLATMIEEALAFENHVVEVAHTGLDGRERLFVSKYDAIILDWTLPDISGLEICQQFRSSGGATPIIFLSGKALLADKAQGFGSGADDYLTKPFQMKELSLRLGALLRRPPLYQNDVLKVRDVELDSNQRRVTKNGQEVKLFPKEFALLEFLIRHQNQVFTNDQLLAHIWPSDSTACVESLRQSMARLRQAIDNNRDDPLLKTIYGVGYKLQI